MRATRLEEISVHRGFPAQCFEPRDERLIGRGVLQRRLVRPDGPSDVARLVQDIGQKERCVGERRRELERPLERVLRRGRLPEQIRRHARTEMARGVARFRVERQGEGGGRILMTTVADGLPALLRFDVRPRPWNALRRGRGRTHDCRECERRPVKPAHSRNGNRDGVRGWSSAPDGAMMRCENARASAE